MPYACIECFSLPISSLPQSPIPKSFSKPQTPCKPHAHATHGGTNERRGRKQKRKICTTPTLQKRKHHATEAVYLLVACILHPGNITSSFFLFGDGWRAGCILSCPRSNLPWQLKAITCCVTKPLACHHITVYASINDARMHACCSREKLRRGCSRRSTVNGGAGIHPRVQIRKPPREALGSVIRHRRSICMSRRHRTPCLENGRLSWGYGETGGWGLVLLVDNAGVHLQAHSRVKIWRPFLTVTLLLLSLQSTLDDDAIMHHAQLTSPSWRFMQVEVEDSLLGESRLVNPVHAEIDA